MTHKARTIGYITALILAIVFNLYCWNYFSSFKIIMKEEMVVIDSVSSYTPNGPLPDIKWVYHTRLGNVYSNRNQYNKGDSVKVKMYFYK